MKYLCYIKSHCEAPDWEQETEADNKEEACMIFSAMTHGEFDTEMIAPYVEQEHI